MSVRGGLDPFLKEVLTACAALPAADADARRAFWAQLDDWQTRLDNLGTALRANAIAALTQRGRGGTRDPRQADRPHAARAALLDLHFGRSDLGGGGTPSERIRADVDHIAYKIRTSSVLAEHMQVGQRLNLAKAKLLKARNTVPDDVHVAVLALIVRCYRAFREATAGG